AGIVDERINISGALLVDNFTPGTKASLVNAERLAARTGQLGFGVGVASDEARCDALPSRFRLRPLAEMQSSFAPA
ncbi:MAG: hypothetical protein WA579_02090, partial [Rhodomicrobium sp.]